MHAGITLHVNTVALLAARHNEVNMSCKHYVHIKILRGRSCLRREIKQKINILLWFKSLEISVFVKFQAFAEGVDGILLELKV